MNEMLRKGMRQSPLAKSQVLGVLNRIDQLGKRDVLVFNALLKISIFRKELGPREDFLAEMNAAQVVPSSETLSLLLQTFTLEEWKSGEVDRFCASFTKQYKVSKDWRCGLIEMQAWAKLGQADKCLAVMRRCGKSLSDRSEAWQWLVESQARGGNLSGALASAVTMGRSGHSTWAVGQALCVVMQHAQRGDAALVEQVVETMREMHIEPSLEMVSAIERIV